MRSIPAVFGVRDGKAVDGFVGLQSEAMIRAWLDRLLPTPAEQIAAHAPRTGGDRSEGCRGQVQFGPLVRPGSAGGQLGLARIALEQGRLEDAQAQIVSLERRGYLEPEAEKLKAELTLRLQAQQAGGRPLEEARAALAAKPG